LPPKGLAISAAKFYGVIGFWFHLKGRVKQPTPAGHPFSAKKALKTFAFVAQVVQLK